MYQEAKWATIILYKEMVLHMQLIMNYKMKTEALSLPPESKEFILRK